MVSEVTKLCLYIVDPASTTNVKHGLLSCLLEILLLFKNERSEDFNSKKAILKKAIEEIGLRLNAADCFVLRIQLHEISKVVGADMAVQDENAIYAKHHPGLFEWRMLHSKFQLDFETLEDDDDFVIKSREDGLKIIRLLTHSDNSLPPTRAVYLLNRCAWFKVLNKIKPVKSSMPI